MKSLFPFKKLKPTSPDKIQKFASQSEAALVRMSHLNRLALYVGSEMEVHDPVDYEETIAVNISKPTGYVRFVNLNTAAGTSDTIVLVFDPALGDEAVGIPTPSFVQLTMASADAIVVISVHNSPIVDGTVEVKFANVDASNTLTEAAFYYTVIPQLI